MYPVESCRRRCRLVGFRDIIIGCGLYHHGTSEVHYVHYCTITPRLGYVPTDENIPNTSQCVSELKNKYNGSKLLAIWTILITVQ